MPRPKRSAPRATPPPDDTALLNALSMVESKNNPKAVGDQGLAHPAYGAFQMREPAFQDVQQSYPQYRTMHVEDLLSHPELQRQVADAYLNVLRHRYHLSALNDLIEAYNAGPTAVRQHRIKPSTLKYLHDVQGYLNSSQ